MRERLFVKLSTVVTRIISWNNPQKKKYGKKQTNKQKQKEQRVCCEKECTSPRQLELLFKVSNDISEKVTMDSLRLTARNSKKYEVFCNFVLIKLSICIKE